MKRHYNRRQRRTGFVYFIAPEAALFRDEMTVKIGFTSDSPEKRLKTFETGSPLPLEIIAYTDGSVALEMALHQTFAPLRSHGEWFYLADKLWGLLSYLYDKPDRRYVDRITVSDALFDNVMPSCVPHPNFSQESWNSSARHWHLKPFFPELFDAVGQ